MAVILPRDKNHIPLQGNPNVHSDIDTGLITSGSMFFTASEVLTTASSTSVVTLLSGGNELVHPDGLFLLVIEKSGSPGDSAGDLTVRTYNRIATDGVNKRDVLHTTHTVEVASTSTSKTHRDFIVQGLFMGNGTKLDFAFATNVASAHSVYYKIYRI